MSHNLKLKLNKKP